MDFSPAVLSHIPLFRTLPPAELERLAGLFRRVEVPADEVLFREGDPGASFYIIQHGQMEVFKTLNGQEHLLVVRRPGDYFGEMSLISPDHRRTATVRARTPVVLQALTQAEFDGLLERNPRLAYDMVRLQSQRLNDANDTAIRGLQEKNRQLSEAYDELKAAQEQIIAKEKLEQELRVAHDIQMSILPRELPVLPGFSLGASLATMTAVGGDFYDFIELSPGQLGVVIGDVSGHGVPAALVMALTVALLRAAASPGVSPGEVVSRVNEQLIHLNGESMFVTLLYGVLARDTSEFVFARAGHCLPLQVLADGQVCAVPRERSMAIGLFPDTPVSVQTLTLRPGERLLCYTDGVTEAAGLDGELYGEERLRQDVLELRGLTAQSACDEILARVGAFAAGPEQGDDITLICIDAGPG